MQKPGKWTKTYYRLLEADRENTLEPEELKTLALAAYLTGRDTESFQILERAHKGYLNGEMLKEAVRCAFWLGLMLMNAGERARSSGWFARGERLSNNNGMEESAEGALLHIPGALQAIAAGKAAEAGKIFEGVIRTGERFQDSTLKILGRLGLGQAMVQQEAVDQGIKLLDETMVTLETEEAFPLINGIVYCAVIETCRRVWDLERAQEWTSALSRWCEAQPDIVPFRGECMVRRAEIFQLHGEWPKALKETQEACALFTGGKGASAVGEAFYRHAELHRLAGDFEKAESSFNEAARRGRTPQPGLSLLRLAQGQKEAAEISIRNILRETKDRLKRAEILPAVVSIMLAVDRPGEALEAASELRDLAYDLNTPYLHAISASRQAAVDLAHEKDQAALEHIQLALQLWSELHLPYETASARELKGLIYREMKDKDNSEAELAAARWIYQQLNAKPDVQRIDRLLKANDSHVTHGLTLRELQVLHLVASGKTNREVAGDLFISERTVDRHMSNIFNKLDVSSRVEATALAIRNNILDNPL